ncbi:MAG TPA: PKD domain-containing protein [Baekduia sp.]|nr:PKD domain-containing protein [Baekduia sp.]
MRRAVVLLAALAVALWLAPAAAAKTTVPQRMVGIARAELAKGVREVPDGSNRGSRIRMYGQSTNPRFYPAPWCAYFVSWVSRRAGRPLGPAGQGFGYVPYLRAWAQRTGAWRRTPKSGDLVMFPQHVGLVEHVYANGTLTTIEGNSSNRVARRWRRWKDASGYVRVAAGGTVQRPGKGAPLTPVSKRREKLAARISVYPSRTVAVGQAVGFSANDSSGDIVRYRWDLDADGSFDDARGDNAERAYRKAGDVKVGLRVTDRRGRTSKAYVTVQVRDNQAPVAVLDVPETVRITTDVTLHADDSWDPDGDIVRYEWDVDGDGVWTAGGDHAEVRFTAPGVHTVGLRVVDDRGAVTEAVRTILVTHKDPVAKATLPSSAGLGKEVALDGSRSYDPDGEVASYGWDVGADGVIDAEGRRVPWRFATPGKQPVRLVVRDQWGAEATYDASVTVTNAASVAVITSPALPVAGDDLTFDASRSTDPDSRLTTYEWDLDEDGAWDATGLQATWRFTGTGDRRVRLRVTDEWGATKTSEKTFRLLLRPVAAVQRTTAMPLAGSPVTFTGTGSSDPDGSIDRLEWDFDDDGDTDATTWRAWRSATTTFWQRGTHTVAMTVVDDDGLRTTVRVPVTVG